MQTQSNRCANRAIFIESQFESAPGIMLLTPVCRSVVVTPNEIVLLPIELNNVISAGLVSCLEKSLSHESVRISILSNGRSPVLLILHFRGRMAS